MVIWQRNESVSNDDNYIARIRERTIKENDLPAFQTLSVSPVNKIQRPRPTFQDGTRFETEDWLKPNVVSLARKEQVLHGCSVDSLTQIIVYHNGRDLMLESNRAHQ